MKKSYKWTLGALASLAIGCGSLGAALFAKPVEALAEDVGTPVAYINVGASGALTANEFYYENPALAADTSVAGTAGANAEGLGVFATYRTGASVSVTVTAGDYQVAALVDADGAISVNGGDAVSANGKRLISADVTADGTVTVSTEANVKLYAVMVAPKDSKILMHSEWTEQQVVVYGKLLDDELARGCPAFYSDGSVESAIEYSSIPAGVGDGSTGANENFNSVTAKGTYTATDKPVEVERALIVMPERLVYFLNAGSVTNHTGPFGDDSDPCYSYNKTVFDYYKSVGSTLLNDGVPDADSTGTNSFGHYENGWNGGDKSYPYPFNTGRVTRNSDFHTSNLGFRLPNVEAGSYKLYLGTVSYWHGRTLGVKINGVAQDNISAPPSRVVHTFDVTLATKGTVEIYLTGADTNEALTSFVALQKAEDAPAEAPADLSSDSKTVGLAARSLQLTGVQEGAIVQIYGGSRPYKFIYEETAVAENFESGVYTLAYGDPIAEKIIQEEKILVVQRNAGGYGKAYEFAVTSIKDFTARYTVNGESGLKAPKYTTGDIVVTVSAKAEDGLTACWVRKGYGDYEKFSFDSVTSAKQDYTVRENGSYEFVFWSGPAKYAERIEINHIDSAAPKLTVTPAFKANSWTGNKYPVQITVDAVSGVEKYEAVSGGQTILSGETNDTEFVLDFPQAGEYYVTVTSGSKQSATAMIVVGNKPVYSALKKTPKGRDLVELTFSCLDGYNMSSLTVYEVVGSALSKLSVLGTDQVEIYNEGTYAAVVKTREGTTEVYSFEIGSGDFKKANNTKPGSGAGESYTGTIVAACIFGVAVIGLVLALLLTGKKKPAMQTAEEEAAPAVEEEETVVTEVAEEAKKEEPQTENEATGSEEDAPDDDSPEEDDE